MSTQQPEALRLANAIDYPDVTFGIEAAAELRRLHSVNSELLEALKDAVSRQAYREGSGPAWWENARAAIAKATGDA